MPEQQPDPAAPATRAAATKSRPATEAAIVCASRANAGASAKPTASTAPRVPTPKMTEKNNTSSSPGNATAMFTAAINSRPSGRGSTEGSVPSTSPATTPSTIASRASTIDSRVATRTR